MQKTKAMKKITWAAAASAALLATGCDEATQEKFDSRHQTQKKTLPLSPEVTLTAEGKRMQAIGNFPTTVAVDPGNFDLSSVSHGADCTLTSATFTARAKLGKRLNLPSYGRATPPMKVSCQIGRKTYSETVEAVNLTVAAYQTEAAGHVLFGLGLAGALFTAGTSENRDKSKDIFGYPVKIEIGR